jgi:hypothetical protein
MSESQIFQLLGVAYTAIGLGALINPKFFQQLLGQFIRELPIFYLNGALALFLGYLLATYPFSGATDMAWILKVLGWLGIVKGVLVLLLPKQYLEMLKGFRHNLSFMIFESFVIVLLGSALMYIGFVL